MTETFKTSQDIIREQEMQELLEIIRIRNNVLSYYGTDKLFDRIKEAVESSETFDYRSEFAKEAAGDNLSVSLKIISYKQIHKPLDKSDNEIELYTKSVVNVLTREINSVTVDVFNQVLAENDDFAKDLNKLDENMKSLFFSSIFGITVTEPQVNNIIVRMIV